MGGQKYVGREGGGMKTHKMVDNGGAGTRLGCNNRNRA